MATRLVSVFFSWQDIDRIMGVHGAKIMGSIRPILENEAQAAEVKEQVPFQTRSESTYCLACGKSVQSHAQSKVARVLNTGGHNSCLRYSVTFFKSRKKSEIMDCSPNLPC